MGFAFINSAFGQISTVAADHPDALARTNMIDLDYLAITPGAWPPTVSLVKIVTVPVIIKGKEMGSVEVPIGTDVKVLRVTKDKIVIGYMGGTKSIPISSTDLPDRVAANRNTSSSNTSRLTEGAEETSSHSSEKMSSDSRRTRHTLTVGDRQANLELYSYAADKLKSLLMPNGIPKRDIEPIDWSINISDSPIVITDSGVAETKITPSFNRAYGQNIQIRLYTCYDFKTNSVATITYLMPFSELKRSSVFRNKRINAKCPIVTPGFPRHSLFYYPISGSFSDISDRSKFPAFTWPYLFVIVDINDLVVGVQFGMDIGISGEHVSNGSASVYDFVKCRTVSDALWEIKHTTTPLAMGGIAVNSTLNRKAGKKPNTQPKLEGSSLLYLPQPMVNTLLFGLATDEELKAAHVTNDIKGSVTLIVNGGQTIYRPNQIFTPPGGKTIVSSSRPILGAQAEIDCYLGLHLNEAIKIASMKDPEFAMAFRWGESDADPSNPLYTTICLKRGDEKIYLKQGNYGNEILKSGDVIEISTRPW